MNGSTLAALKRLRIVALFHLGAFETVQQLSVRWRESSEEMALLTLYGATLGALIWATSPPLQWHQDQTAQAAAVLRHGCGCDRLPLRDRLRILLAHSAQRL